MKTEQTELRKKGGGKKSKSCQRTVRKDNKKRAKKEVKRMFENSAERLKKFAIALFWLSIAISVILAFVFGWETIEETFYTRSYKVFHAEYFFTFLIGCPLVSYISTLFLVAFGDLVENAQRIKEVTEEIKKEKNE